MGGIMKSANRVISKSLTGYAGALMGTGDYTMDYGEIKQFPVLEAHEMQESCGDFIDGDRHSYDEVLEELPGRLVSSVDLGDYQGDTLAVFKRRGKYAFLVFGWGSCSGCDALYGCNDWEDFCELRESLVGSMRWFPNLKGLQTYFKAKDWETEWYCMFDNKDKCPGVGW